MSRSSSLLHPLGFGNRYRHHFLVGPAHQAQGVLRAGLHTHAAANAAQLVDLGEQIHAQGIELTVFQAVLASDAQVFVNHVDEG